MLFASFLLWPCAPAHATGGFDCAADDKTLSFAASAVVGRGLVTGLMNFRSSVEIHWERVPTDLCKPDMVAALKQSWWEGKDLRLHFYAERQTHEPFASIELLVLTTEDAEGDTYSGRYTLTYYEVGTPDSTTLHKTGKVVCSAE
jgi:hypothetical protein